MNKLYLRFDESRIFGSAEHFYHFMWGYLLPALFEILCRLGHRPPVLSDTCYLFRSCGPVMDKLLHEVLTDLCIDFRIDDKHRLNTQADLASMVVPRWDVWIYEGWTNDPGALRAIQHTPHPFSDHIAILRSLLLKKWLTPPTKRQAHTKPTFLLLKRSPQHSYYEPGGAAEISGYGTGRRGLHGLESACDLLNEQGLPCVIFEPGRHSLREQVHAFHHCRGVIAMRGAEVANLIWLKPHSKVVFLNPSTAMPVPPSSRVFVSMFHLDYREVDLGSDMQAVFDPMALIHLLSEGAPGKTSRLFSRLLGFWSRSGKSASQQH